MPLTWRLHLYITSTSPQVLICVAGQQCGDDDQKIIIWYSLVVDIYMVGIYTM